MTRPSERTGGHTPPTPFAIPAFRRQWLADFSASCAFEMETIALAWYLLLQTQSVIYITALASLQFLGTLLSPFIGVLGDRYGSRQVLTTMRLVFVCISAAVVLLAWLDVLIPPVVLLMAGLTGLFRPSDLSFRNVLVSQIVPPVLLMKSISLSRITNDLSRVLGALLGAGLMALIGFEGAYAVLVLMFVLAVGCTWTVQLPADARPARYAPGTGPSVFSHVRVAMREVWSHPPQLATLSLAFIVNLTAFPFTLGLLPYVAGEHFGSNQLGLGYLVASAAAGGVLASLLLGRLPRVPRPGIVMLVFSVAWHAMLVVFALSPTFEWGLATIFVTGFVQGLCIVPMAVFLLGNTEPALRASVLGLRSLAVYGLPVGLMVAGFLLDGWLSLAQLALLYAATGVGLTLLLVWRWGRHLG